MKDGQGARAHPVGLVTRGHRGDQGIQAPQEQQDHQDTVTRIPVWDTTSEVCLGKAMSHYTGGGEVVC